MQRLRARLSFDSAASSPTMTAYVCPLPSYAISDMASSERDNGLRRIRQAPSRKASGPSPNPGTLNNLSKPYRSSSHPLPGAAITGPPSPLMVLSEDLSRFPQESLHSFSFAHQSEESLQNRQNVLRRSVDFLKSKVNRTPPGTAYPRAAARLSGEEELSNVMDILQKANLLAQSPQAFRQSDRNDQSTLPSVESLDPILSTDTPTTSQPLSLSIPEKCASPEECSPTAVLGTADDVSYLKLQRIQSETAAQEPPSQALYSRRSQLKRTFTGLEHHSQGGELLRSQNTHALDRAMQASVTSPVMSPTSDGSYRRHMTIPSNDTPHAHGKRQHVAAQAIFTTDTNSPWTITAANDLACLAFGVSMAEVRKMGIMEVICPDRRVWLERKLRRQETGKTTQQSSADQSPPPGTQTRSSSTSPRLGTGVTAKLLSKPPSRELKQVRLDSARASRPPLSRSGSTPRPGGGVLLCGDVVTIQKRNGTTGSASLWVKEKQGGFIWVLEEIAEDFAILTLDEVGCIIKGAGSIEAIFGMERVRRGMDVKKLLPQLPKQSGTHTGALDYERILETRRYTARTSNSINIPVTVDLLPGDELAMRISSFPHVAGIMVLSAETLCITSSNTVFSASLFGYDCPDGFHINELIPHFETLLGVISDEDSAELVDGIVIPEQSFRRARSLLAIRQGRADAASIFLRPSGLPAKHRDGSEIMIDLQMRVLNNDVPISDSAIAEDGEQGPGKVSYALWITYSRQLHAVNHGVGPVSPLAMSRPGTPPRQPAPLPLPTPVIEEGVSDHSSPAGSKAVSPILEHPEPNMSTKPSLEHEMFEHPTAQALAAGAQLTPKKAIADFVVLEEMGQGAYGEVKLVRYKKASAQKMVVKYVTKRRILVDTWTRDRKLGTVPLEIHVLDFLRRDGLQHRNIVEMADFFEDDINYYIEMVPHGLPGMDLFDYIEMRANMQESECRQIFVQVANALHHLHTKARVVHRDVKDENVILDGQGAVKVVDFGSAAYIKSGPFDVFVGTIGKYHLIDTHP